MRRMSKSAVRVAREAPAAGRAALPRYSSRYSRRDHTQPRLFALLALRQFLRTDYRGAVALAAEWSELRRALGLERSRATRRWRTPRAASWRARRPGGRSAAPKPRWSDAPAGGA